MSYAETKTYVSFDVMGCADAANQSAVMGGPDAADQLALMSGANLSPIQPCVRSGASS
jgi:hypothetical protein